MPRIIGLNGMLQIPTVTKVTVYHYIMVICNPMAKIECDGVSDFYAMATRAFGVDAVVRNTATKCEDSLCGVISYINKTLAKV